MFSRPKILFLVSLLFVALLNSIPTYLLNFYHSGLFAFYICSGCTQNVTGTYVIIRRLLTTCLHGKAAVLCEISGALHLAQPNHTAGRLADEIQVNFEIFRVGCRSKYSTCCFV